MKNVSYRSATVFTSFPFVNAFSLPNISLTLAGVRGGRRSVVQMRSNPLKLEVEATLPLSSSSTLPRSQRQVESLMTEEIDDLMSQQNPLPGWDSGLNHHGQFKIRAYCCNRICSDPIDDRCSSEQICGMSSTPSSNRRNAKFATKKSHVFVRDKVLHIIPHTCLHEAPPTLVVGGTVETNRQVGLQP